MGENVHEKRERSGRSRSGNSKPPKLSFGDYRFVRIELSSVEKDDFKDALAEKRFTPLAFAEYFALGYTIKFSPADGGKTVVCTLTCANPSHSNAGLSISGRAGDPETAFAVVCYKDLVICDDGQWAKSEYERGGATPDIG